MKEIMGPQTKMAPSMRWRKGSKIIMGELYDVRRGSVTHELLEKTLDGLDMQCLSQKVSCYWNIQGLLLECAVCDGRLQLAEMYKLCWWNEARVEGSLRLPCINLVFKFQTEWLIFLALVLWTNSEWQALIVKFLSHTSVLHLSMISRTFWSIHQIFVRCLLFYLMFNLSFSSDNSWPFCMISFVDIQVAFFIVHELPPLPDSNCSFHLMYTFCLIQSYFYQYDTVISDTSPTGAHVDTTTIISYRIRRNKHPGLLQNYQDW